jgi:hypothetical protein
LYVTTQHILTTLAKIAEAGLLRMSDSPQPAETGVGIIHVGVPGSWSGFDHGEMRTLLLSCVSRGLAVAYPNERGSTIYRLTDLGVEVHAGRQPAPPPRDPDAVVASENLGGIRGFEMAIRGAHAVGVERGSL